MRINLTLPLAIFSLVAANVSYAGDNVPFKMTGTAGLTNSEGIEDDPDFVIKNTFQGEAKATQLGKNSLAGVQIFTVSNTAEPGVPIFGTFSQTSTHTAANGDTLVIESVGVFLVVPFVDGELLRFAPIAGEGTWKVVGGTGRFESATGGGIVTTGLTDDGLISFENEGEISSVGSSRGRRNGRK